MVDIQQIINKDWAQEIISTPEFYFQKGQDLIKEWLDLQIPETLKQELASLANNYERFQEEAKIKPALKNIQELLFEIISYCDTKAKDKHFYNKYEDKRVLAMASVRMNNWIENLIKFKLTPDSVISTSINNAINYLLEPKNNSTILSQKHRELVSKNLFSKPFDSQNFVNDLKTSFQDQNIATVNEDNYTHLLSRIVYSLQEEWKEEIIALMASDNTGWQDYHIKERKGYTYSILWNSKTPSGTIKTLEYLKSVIEEKGSFNLYYCSKGLVRYRASIVDFARDQADLNKKDWSTKNVLHYHPNFNNYANGTKKARIVFLAESLEKIKPIPVSSFKFFSPYQPPTQDNISPVKTEPSPIITEPQEITNITPDSTKNNSMSEYKPPLNQILYGPPGTGKTFHTIDKALEIINKNLKGSRGEMKKTFDEKVKAGQIVFTTFHQSLSYEDFIEGIKPKTENEKVLYEIEEGIFKSICNKARPSSGNFEEVIEGFKTEVSEADGKEPLTINSKASKFDVVFRGTNVFYVQPHNSTKKNPWYPVNILNIRKAFETDSFDGVYNPTYVREIINYLKQNKNLVKGDENTTIPKPFVLIIDEINRGNVSQIFGELITLIEEDKRLGKNEQLEVTLPYSKETFSVPANLYIIGTMNTADRSVEALDTALRRRFSFVEMPPNPELLSPGYQYWRLLWDYKDIPWENEEFKSKEEALFKFTGASQKIQDERKNIWEDMRKEGELTTQVQRFPQAEFSGINLQKLLTTINQRIEKLLNKDHLIGHSFFMKVSNMEMLLEAFQNKITPLLQEYFYGDFGKIGLVLGEGFVREKNTAKSDNLFANFDYEASVFDDKKVYELVDYSQQHNYILKINNVDVPMTFEKAIKLLMKESIA